jgi:hypothetical protein
VRRRRGRRLLMAQLLLFLRRLFYRLLRCCFLRCHVISTSLRCQNVEQCVSGISEFVERVHFSLLDISVGWKRVPEIFSFYGELDDRPLRASMDGDARCARQAERTRPRLVHLVYLVDPRVRASNEQILIVHVPRARRTPGRSSPILRGRALRERRRPTGYAGARFHLMLQPMLALCVLSTGFPASAALIAARRSRPVTGLLLPGRLSSSCPW